MKMNSKYLSNKRKIFSPFDILIIAFVLIIAATSFFVFTLKHDEDALFAKITVNGQLYKTIDLKSVNEPYNMKIPGKLTLTVYVEHNAITVVDSQCADKVCVNTGKLTKTGSSCVCLPARVSITLVGEKSKYDGVTG